MTQDFPEEYGGLQDPIEITKLWLEEASGTALENPNAFVLSTVDSEGQAQSRVLLCKEVSDSELSFYTNFQSAKGLELQSQSKAAMNFFWDSMARQIRITGEVRRMDRKDSIRYWDSRDRMSQLSQWVSKQSQDLSSRDEMENAIAEADKKFAGESVTCPDHWGGYWLSPQCIELWVGRTSRFHDRHRFTMVENAWTCQRLYP